VRNDVLAAQSQPAIALAIICHAQAEETNFQRSGARVNAL